MLSAKRKSEQDMIKARTDPSVIRVAIHSSQFPDAVRSDLLDSLRRGAVNHKFHYDSIKQAQAWLMLHEACSPARTRPEVSATYDRAFERTARIVSPGRTHVVGLGCGGGAKECALLGRLAGRTIDYTPVDVSTALVVKSWQAARDIVPSDRCYPLVCDLARAEDLPVLIDEQTAAGSTRLDMAGAPAASLRRFEDRLREIKSPPAKRNNCLAAPAGMPFQASPACQS